MSGRVCWCMVRNNDHHETTTRSLNVTPKTTLRGVYIATQLNSTQLTQLNLNSVQPSQSCFRLWRHDLQTESTVVHAVELSSVELSCVAMNGPLRAAEVNLRAWVTIIKESAWVIILLRITILTDTKHRAACLQQPSYLFYSLYVFNCKSAIIGFLRMDEGYKSTPTTGRLTLQHAKLIICTSNKKLVHWRLMGGLTFGTARSGRGRSSPRLLLAVPN